jgi:hypothetical protein
MATAFWLIFTALNTQFILLIITTVKIQPDALWWRITVQVISIAVMVLLVTFLYRIMHYAMGLKPVRYLVRFTSLTAFGFWRRYKFLKNNKREASSANQEIIVK